MKRIMTFFITFSLLYILCSCSINPWFTVGLDVDMTPPQLTIDSHNDFDYVKGTFVLYGTCTDNVDITKVMVSIKSADTSYQLSEQKAFLKNNRWSYTVHTGENGLPDGEYCFTIQACDAQKNESTDSIKSVTLTVDNAPSVVTISYPPRRSSISAWDNTSDKFLPEMADFYLNDNFYIQGNIDETFQVKTLELLLTEITSSNEETGKHLHVIMDENKQISVDSNDSNIDEKILSIDTTKKSPTLWSWKFYFTENAEGEDILKERYYKLTTVVRDAALNEDKKEHGYICVLPQADYPYIIFNSFGEKIPVGTPLTGKACDDDGISKVVIELYNKNGVLMEGKTDTYIPSDSQTSFGTFYNWKTVNSVPTIGGDYTLHVTATDINGNTNLDTYDMTNYIVPEEYRQKPLLMMDLSAPTIDIQGLLGKHDTIKPTDNPFDFDEYSDIVDTSGDFTLVCNVSDASQVNKIYMAQLLPNITDDEREQLTAIDTESNNIKWHIDWGSENEKTIDHIKYFRLYEYTSGDSQKVTKYKSFNIYDDFNNTYDKKTFYVYAENASEKTTVSYRTLSSEPNKPIINILNPVQGTTLTNVFSISVDVSDDTGIKDFTIEAIQNATENGSQSGWDGPKSILFDKIKSSAFYSSDISGLNKEISVTSIPSTFFYTGDNPFEGGVCTLTFTAIDLYGNKAVEKLQFYIDTARPFIKNISSSPSVASYKANDIITIKMEVSKKVTVNTAGGIPKLILDNNGIAEYTSTDEAGNSLIFKYTVKSTDENKQLGCTEFQQNGAVIKDDQNYNLQTANFPDSGIGSLKSNASIKIDTVAPTISNVKTLTGNGWYSTQTSNSKIEIQVIFSENVAITGGTPRLKLNAQKNGEYCYALYDEEASSANKAVFIYEITSGANTPNGQKLKWTEWDANGSTITDMANSGSSGQGNPFVPPTNSVIESNHQWSNNIYIDTTSPSVTGITLNNAVSLAQALNSDGVYYCNAEKKIDLVVEFDEVINTTGSPTLQFNEISTNDTSTQAVYVSGNGSKRLTFTYTVRNNDNTNNYLKISKINGTITDQAKNPIPSEYTGAINKNIIIDTNAPDKPTLLLTPNTPNASKTDTSGNIINIYTGLNAERKTTGVTISFVTDEAFDYNWTTNDVSDGWRNGTGDSKTFGANENEGFYQEYQVSLQLRDKAGNLSPSSNVIFDIDSNKPKLTGVNSSAIISGNLKTTVTGTYVAGETIYISLIFNKDVKVTEPLTIHLNNNKDFTISKNTQTEHIAGSSDYYLKKEYIVSANESAVNLDIESITDGKVQDLSLNNVLTYTDLNDALASVSKITSSQFINIDTTQPEITEISTSTASGWYTVGKIILITVSFSEAVRYTGTQPTLSLNNGAKATYISGSGTRDWIFSYGVENNQSTGSSDVSLNTSNYLYVSRIDGKITDMTGVSKQGNELVSYVPPQNIENMKTNKIGIDTDKPKTLTITAKDGAQQSVSNNATTGKTPVTVSISQSEETNAKYYVTVNGEVRNNWGVYTPTIECAAPVNSTLTYNVAVKQKDIAGNISDEKSITFTVDNSEVKLESISTSHENGTCTVNDVIPLILKFNKKVKITSPIKLTLNAVNGTEPIIITIPKETSTSNSVFQTEKTINYTVGNGHATTEILNVVGITGTVQDQLNKQQIFSNDTLSEISNLSAATQITIDTDAPSLESITTTANGWFKANAKIAIFMRFNEDVKITDNDSEKPFLKLSSGGTAEYSSHSGRTMTFIYTVANGNTTGNSTNNFKVTQFNGKITDLAGNSFSFTNIPYAIKDDITPAANASVGIDTTIGSIVVTNTTSSETIQNNTSRGYLVNQTLKFTGISDAGSGVNTEKTTLTFDGGDPQPLTNGLTQLCDAEENSKSVHVISAVMTDNAGNVSQINFSITIDGTEISLEKISTAKPNGTYMADSTIDVTLTFSTLVRVTSELTLTLNNGGTVKVPADAEFSSDKHGIYDVSINGTDTISDAALTILSITGKVMDNRGEAKAISSWASHISALNLKNANLADFKSIYIDKTAPQLTAVSTASADGWYKEGDKIPLTLTFDEDIQVTGAPILSLSSGGTAEYISHSGTEISFIYTVHSGNTTNTSKNLKVTGITGGTITDNAKVSGNVFSASTYPALTKSDKSSAAQIGIDTSITPIVIKNGSTDITNKSYTNNNSLKYYRSQTLTVSWTADSGSPSTATYTVNGESKGNISNNGTISCQLAEDAIASYLVVVTKTDTAGNTTSSNAEIQINGEEIKLVSVTSETPNGTYIPTNNINLTLNFNKAVKLTQAASLSLNNGKTLTINATNDYNTSISTTYTVDASEDTPAEENLTVSSFSAGKVQDERGADTERELSALLAAASNLNESKAIKIDTVKPTLSLMTTSADGWYKANDQIAVTLTFSEDVKVTGTPTVTMSTGTTATYQTGSGTKNLMFVYKVAAGNSTGANKNLYISSLSGLAGKITDSAGNAYTPISSEYGTGKLKKASATSIAATVGIDTTAPTLTITNTTSGGTISDGVTVNKAAAQTIQFAYSDSGSSINASQTKYIVNGTSNELTNGKTYTCTETAGTKNAYAITAMATDNAGNTTTISFTVIIDGTPIVLETITSTTSSGTYKSGVSVPITLTFNNPVKVTSDLTLTFNNGDTMTIPVNGTYKAQISADYTTSSETSTPLTVTSITGTAEDERGSVKAVSTPAQWTSLLASANNLDASKSILIDTTAPTVTSVTTETAAGWYKAGTLIRIMLNCSETVKVTGTPTLSLNLSNGATASYISGSGSDTLTFAYNVGSSDSTGSSQNLSVTGITGTVADIAGNTISTTGTKQLDKNIGIDTSAPKTLTVSGITANAVKYDASTLTISGFGDSGTGSGNASYTVVINGTPYTASKTDTSTISYLGLPTAAQTALTVAAGGRQTFTVTAYQTDQAGNNSTSSSSLTFTIDKNPAKIVSITSSRSNEIIKNGNTMDIVFNFSRALTSVSSPTITLSNGVTGTLSKVTTTQYKYTYTVGTATTQDTSGAALKITSVSGSVTDALTTQTLASLWSDNATYNISGYNVIVDTIAPTLKSSYPTASYNDSTGKATVTYKFSENVEKVGGKKFTLTRTAYAAPIILTPAEYNEYYSQASGIESYYERTINGTSSSGVVDKTSKYVLKYQYDPTESALLALFSGIGYYQSEITIESSNVSISGDTLTVTIPKEQLMTGETYTISADTGLIKDLVGNQCGTITDKDFTTGNTPQLPVIRVNKKSGRGDTAASTTFKIHTETPNAEIYYKENSGSFSKYTSAVSISDTTLISAYAKLDNNSTTVYEKAFKTTLTSSANCPSDTTFLVFRGGDQASGSNTVDNFPLSWDEKTILGHDTYSSLYTGDNNTSEANLLKYGMLLAKDGKAITWAATDKVYFHGLACKEYSGKLVWKWQQQSAVEVNAGGTGTDPNDNGHYFEANWHDVNGNNY